MNRKQKLALAKPKPPVEVVVSNQDTEQIRGEFNAMLESVKSVLDSISKKESTQLTLQEERLIEINNNLVKSLSNMEKAGDNTELLGAIKKLIDKQAPAFPKKLEVSNPTVIPAWVAKDETLAKVSKSLTKLSDGIGGLVEQNKQGQRPEDFVPYRRVRKVGNRLEFDDTYYGASSGGGGGGGSGGAVTNDGTFATPAKQDTANTSLSTIATNTGNGATSANQTTELTRIGDVTETAPASDTGSSGLNGRLQRIAQRLTSLIALLPGSLGQKARASAFAVTLSSEDITALTPPAAITGFATSSNQTNGTQQTKLTDGTNTANVLKSDGTSAGQNSVLTAGTYLSVPFTTTTVRAVGTTDAGNYKHASIHITSQGGSSTITYQGSNDNTNWINVSVLNAASVGTSVGVTSDTGANVLRSVALNYRYFRLNVTGIISGTTAGVIVFSTVPPTQNIINAGATQIGTWTVGSNSATGSAVPANAFYMGLSDGGTLRGWSALSNVTDANTGVSSAVVGPMLYNGSTYDKLRSASAASQTTGTGLLGVGNMAISRTASPTAYSNGNFGLMTMDTVGQLLVATGGLVTTSVPANASNVVVKGSAGRLCNILVTTTGVTAMVVYDNATTNSGTIIGQLPASAAVGSIYQFNMPAANGITIAGSATNPAVTVSWI